MTGGSLYGVGNAFTASTDSVLCSVGGEEFRTMEMYLKSSPVAGVQGEVGQM